MKRKHLNPEGFAHKTGAYSHGITQETASCEMIFITGQIAIDNWGKAVAPGDYGKQTEDILEKINTILAEAGATMHDIVKLTIYVRDISKFDDAAKVRNKYFKDIRPASTLVEISNTTNPGCDIVIEATAIKHKI